MHRILLLLSLINHSYISSAQIVFEENTAWKKVLSKAKLENKLIFMDVYTTWCTPCKEMDKEVFQVKAAGDIFNKAFIPFKTDAEKGEGIDLARTYAVNGYPTYLFIDGTGRLIYKHVGKATMDEMRQIAAVASKEQHNPKTIAVWEAEYLQKKKDTTFLYQYLVKRNQLQLKIGAEFSTYLDLLNKTQQISARTIDLLTANDNFYPVFDSLFGYVITNYSYWKMRLDAISIQQIDIFIERNMRYQFHYLRDKKQEDLFQKFLQLNAAIPGQYLYEDNHQCRETYYRTTNNRVQYMAQVVPYMDSVLLHHAERKGYEWANTLNNAAWFMHLQSDSLYPKALQYIQAAIRLKPEVYPTNFLIYHTYGNILYKMGNKQEAIIQQQKALSMVPANDHLYKEIAEALNAMK